MNPNFILDEAAIESERRRMLEEPTGLDRPLVVLAGWRQLPIGPRNLARRIESLTGADERQVLAISYPLAGDMQKIRRRVIERVEQRWPSPDPAGTIEVDVIGISMGGVVARSLALGNGAGREPGKRLRIARLYTLAAPHRGARLAEWIAPDRASRALKAGSEFLDELDAAHADADYELICYTRLRDFWVGATRTAPHGLQPIWTSPGFLFSHVTIGRDSRILLDIARRLRGERPLAAPGAPPPRD